MGLIAPCGTNMNKLLNYYKGLFAEYYCIVLLFFSGHRILGRRIKTPVGEIDLLTIRGGVFYVIEVKYRASGIDEAKFSMFKSKNRIYRAYLWLRKIGEVKFTYFAMSGFNYEFGDFDYQCR